MNRSAHLWIIVDNAQADTVPTWVARALLSDLRDALATNGAVVPVRAASSVPALSVDGDTYAWPPIVTCSACGMQTKSDAARSGVRWQFPVICPSCYDELLSQEHDA